MVCLNRNKVPYWYCLYEGKTEKTVDGYPTGEYVNTYSEPVKAMGNVSLANGETRQAVFGTEIEYDKIILTDDLASPIDEHSVLFVDKEPEFTDDGYPLFDYRVKRVNHSLESGNSIAIIRVRSE